MISGKRNKTPDCRWLTDARYFQLRTERQSQPQAQNYTPSLSSLSVFNVILNCTSWSSRFWPSFVASLFSYFTFVNYKHGCSPSIFNLVWLVFFSFWKDSELRYQIEALHMLPIWKQEQSFCEFKSENI